MYFVMDGSVEELSEKKKVKLQASCLYSGHAERHLDVSMMAFDPCRAATRKLSERSKSAPRQGSSRSSLDCDISVLIALDTRFSPIRI